MRKSAVLATGLSLSGLIYVGGAQLVAASSVSCTGVANTVVIQVGSDQVFSDGKGNVCVDQQGKPVYVVAVLPPAPTPAPTAANLPDVVVLPPSPPTIAPVLPKTGSDATSPLQMGLVALLAGSGLVAVAAVRRRKPTQPAT